jgi:pyruvate,water dikinase
VSADRAALSAPDAARVASVARRVAGLLGGPQDIEWALAGGAVTVLQARPITALPPVPQDGPAHDGPAQDGPAQDGPAQDGPAPDGFWLRGSYSLKPLSPMNVSTMLPAVNRGSPALFRYALGSRIEVRSVDGWSYVRFVQPGDPGEIQAKLTGIAAALRAGEPGRIVRRWLTRWEPVAVARLARMRAVDLAALPDRELASQVVRRLAFAERMQRLHFLVGGAATVEWGALGRFCRDLLGWDVARVLELVVGLPGKTTEPTVALAALVRAAGADPALTVLLTAETPPSVAAVARRNPGYAALLRDYLRGYGQRCLGADVAEPTMEERPGAMLRVVADALRTGRDPAEEIARAAAARIAAVDRAEAELARFPARVRAEFTALRARAEAAYPLRDDTAFFGHVAWGQFRAVLLVVGARLARRGRLEDGTDVFRLTVGEAVAALTDGADRRGLAASRAAQVAEAAVRGGPLTIGTPPGPPVRLDEAFAGLPAADRAELEVVRWADAAYRIGMARVEQQGAVLHGVGASAGRYVGPARILISEADFGKLRPGDVLVCPETTPQWSVLFSTVGALVTDTGGLLSHPAIIAREYRVPAVVATGNATGLLRDGQLVAVDGGTGRVEILTGDPPGAPASGSAAAASVAAATSAAVGGRAGGGPA